jgi:putative hydrolase of the HAD superfamily
MRIEAILFDADGVIQKPPEARRARLNQLLGSAVNVDEFLADIFAAEELALDGQSDFAEAFSNVLRRWHWQGTLQDALDAWTMIEVNQEMADTVELLRRLGIACYLATNQEPYRARYMSEILGYRNLFDKEFYSCRVGVAKPAGAYFRAVLREIGVQPARALFLDDHEANVNSARAEGLHSSLFTLEAGHLELQRTLKQFGIRVV